MQSANDQSAGAATRGPQAREDTYLSNQEASGAGGNQGGAVQLANEMAQGAGPSAAAYQLQAGLNQAQDQQAAIGRSARGQAAMATAGVAAGPSLMAFTIERGTMPTGSPPSALE
jgi:hypothetical protein